MRPRPLRPPMQREAPRVGEGGVDCPRCAAADEEYIWTSDRWRLWAFDRPTGLPVVVLLEPRAHVGEPGELPDELAAELGVLIARIERAVRSVGEIGRVRVCRWGDGSEHLHWWFMARPARIPQLIGSFAAIWDDVLPPTPEDVWRGNLASRRRRARVRMTYHHVMPDRLHFTGDDEADALLAQEPMALLIGFALDQQVPVQTAFSGPLKIKQRLGTLDPGRLAATDPTTFERAFREKPAVHRFPGTMAARIQELSAFVDERYGGRAERLWTEAGDADELRRRIAELPGFGEMKIKALGAVLAKQFGVPAAQGLVPGHPTLGDVDSAEALASYQAAKRAYKASLKS